MSWHIIYTTVMSWHIIYTTVMSWHIIYTTVMSWHIIYTTVMADHSETPAVQEPGEHKTCWTDSKTYEQVMFCFIKESFTLAG